MEKVYCDKCGKEIIESRKSLYGSYWHLYGLVDNYMNVEFCSVECLKEYVKGIK